MRNDNAAVILEKGNFGEECLNDWLLENGINYFQIKQTPQNFAYSFSNAVKRPDYLVVLESLGMLAVDAKNCLLSCGYFTLNKKEAQRALAFEILTRMPFWFAYLHRKETGSAWYWISAFHAYEVGLRRTNGKTNEEFLALSLNEFIPVRVHEDFCKLCSRSLRSARRIVEIYGR